MTYRRCVVYALLRLIVLLAILSVVIGSPSVAAKSSENVASMRLQVGSELSTPELIEQAFVRGEITSEQRLLYLAYALYDYKVLPAQFQSSFEWFGTSYAEEIDEAWKAGSLAKAQPFSPRLKLSLTAYPH